MLLVAAAGHTNAVAALLARWQVDDQLWGGRQTAETYSAPRP